MGSSNVKPQASNEAHDKDHSTKTKNEKNERNHEITKKDESVDCYSVDFDNENYNTDEKERYANIDSDEYVGKEKYDDINKNDSAVNEDDENVKRTNDIDENESPQKLTGTSTTDWREYHDEMKGNLLLKKVADATRVGDRKALELCLPKCEKAGLNDELTVKKARHKLRMLEARDELRSAMKVKDLERLNEAIDDIHRKGFQKELHQDLIDGERMVDLLSRKANGKTMLSFDNNTLSEVRRYKQPPSILHGVLQATLLLLGEDELSTSDWIQCQKLLNPQGSGSVTRKVQDLDYTDIEPEIYARSREILKTYTLDNVKKSSPAATTFYVWSMGIIDDCEKNHGMDEDPPKPADIQRQLELLGRTPSDNMYIPKRTPWPNRPRPTPR